MSFKFDTTRYEGMDGIPKIRYSLQNTTFFIESSPSEIRFSGDMIVDDIDAYSMLAHTQVEAWKRHIEMKRSISNKLRTNLSGH